MTKLIIFGDIYIGKSQTKEWFQNTLVSFREIMNDYGEILLCVLGNLEAPVILQDGHAIEKVGPNLSLRSENITFLKEAGFTALSLANNHIKDFGAQGVIDTIEACKENVIRTFGAGWNAHEASMPLIVKVSEKKVGFLAFAEEEFNLADKTDPGANGFDPYTSYDDIRNAKSQCDYLIVLYHGGIEYYQYPSPLLQKKCRKMVEAGADFVTCQHSHCIGTRERYRGGEILYGQGNTAFGYQKGQPAWNEGLLARISLGEDNHIDYQVLEARPDGVYLASTEKSQETLRKIEIRSAILEDAEALYLKWQAFCAGKAAMYIPLLYGWSRVSNKLNRLLRGKPADFLISKKKRMLTHNMIRCDAHREVLLQVLEGKGAAE